MTVNDFKKCSLCALVLCAAVFVAPLSVRAGFLGGFVGNSTMIDPDSANPTPPPPTNFHVDGIVSFAVYKNDGTTGNWVTDLGLGSVVTALDAVPDDRAAYVYFYQVVNLPTSPFSLSRILISDPMASFNSLGYLKDTVFSDADGSVGPPATNAALGTTTLVDDVVDGTPTQSGAALSSMPFAADAVSVNPLLGDLPVGPATFAEVQFNRIMSFGEGKLTPANPYSSVLFLTTSLSPDYAAGQIENGGPDHRSDGDVPAPALGPGPTPTPEAANWASCGVGLVVGAFVVLRRRRSMSQVVVA